jgi:hypothetical protein
MIRAMLASSAAEYKEVASSNIDALAHVFFFQGEDVAATPVGIESPPSVLAATRA